MVNYSQAKVYKIIDNTNGNIYVGSTCEPTLARRLSGHVSNYNQYLKEKGSYCTSYQILENNNYNIVLIEKCDSVNSRDELKSRERHYIEALTCVNKVIPLRTDKEYKIANKQRRAEQNKKWSEENKDEIAKRTKAYREANKDDIAKRRKAYREANKDKAKEYYMANRDKLIEQMKTYQQNRKNLVKEQNNLSHQAVVN
jgi:hypothetical protein